jgi:hypothetical protein
MSEYYNYWWPLESAEEEELRERNYVLQTDVALEDLRAQFRITKEVCGEDGTLGRAILKCATCHYICGGLKRMRQHLSTCHNYFNVKILGEVFILERSRFFWHCYKCGLELETATELNEHSATHRR